MAPSGRRAWLLGAAAVAAVLVVGTLSAVLASGTSRGGPPSPVVKTTSTPMATSPATDLSRPMPTSAASTSSTVQVLAPAAAHPAAETILALLDKHFTAINDRDYASWSTTVVARRAKDQPQGKWTEDYRSTHDGAVQVTAIDDSGPDAVTVELSFVSEQDLADAPANLHAERICWQSRWPVVDVASGGRLDTPPKGSTTGRAC